MIGVGATWPCSGVNAGVVTNFLIIVTEYLLTAAQGKKSGFESWLERAQCPPWREVWQYKCG